MPGFHSFSFHSQLQKTQLFSPYTFRESLSIPGRSFPTTALSQNLFTHPGLIEIPEAAGSSESIRDRRMQNRSREYFPEENGLPPQAPNLTFGTIIECGNMIEKQNLSVSCCHGNQWSHISLEWTSPTSPFKLWHILCSTLLIYLFSYMIISWECKIFPDPTN